MRAATLRAECLGRQTALSRKAARGYIVQDENTQARAAVRLIETSCAPEHPGFVSLVVLAELVWVLERAYGYERVDVADVLAKLLTTAELRIEVPELARAALGAYVAGPADFADYLVGQMNAKHGCKTTHTFDKRAAKSGLHTLLG